LGQWLERRCLLAEPQQRPVDREQQRGLPRRNIVVDIGEVTTVASLSNDDTEPGPRRCSAMGSEKQNRRGGVSRFPKALPRQAPSYEGLA